MLTRTGKIVLSVPLMAGSLLSLAIVLHPWDGLPLEAAAKPISLAASAEPSRPEGDAPAQAASAGAAPTADAPDAAAAGSTFAPAAEAAAPSPPPAEPSAPAPRTMRMLVTAYCPCARCCGAHSNGRTASGASIHAHGSMFVAADTRRLPFGTRLSVPGYYGGAPVSVLDRGGRIKGCRLDVFFLSHARAKAWGSRWLDVTVY